MKLKKLTVACALACAAISGQSFALTAFEAPTVKATLSGASAPQNILGALAAQMFVNTTADPTFVYYDDNGTPANLTDDGRSYRAYFGVVKSDASIPLALRGVKAMIVDRAKGGSVWGVDPVARAQPIQTLNVSAASCTLSGAQYRCATIGTDPSLPGYPAGGEVVSDFGVSDVEPNMFKESLNVEFGQTQLTPAEAARLSTFAVNALMMGLPVTASVPTTTYISRAAFGGMLSNLIQDWNLVDPTIPVGSPVTVCRRVQGSGTQASYNWFFNNFPCSTAATAPARMSDSASYALGTVTGTGTTADPFVITASDGYTVVENPSSGNVRDCLTRAQTGGNHDFTGDDGMRYRINFGAGGNRAIGTASLDSAGSEGGNWSFRNMDGAGNFLAGVTSGTGVAPSKFNLREARYDFAVELTMQYRNTTVNGVAPLTGLKKTFVDEFIKRAGDPAVLSAISSVPLRDAVIALPPTYDPNDPVNGGNVAKATRFGNTCGPLQKIY